MCEARCTIAASLGNTWPRASSVPRLRGIATKDRRDQAGGAPR
jgi:hypothetical protein